MDWQCPRIEQPYNVIDPFTIRGHPSMLKMDPQLMDQQQQIFLCATTREHDEIARRKAEHMEAIEHIAPQHRYPNHTYGHRSSRCGSPGSAASFSVSRTTDSCLTHPLQPVLAAADFVCFSGSPNALFASIFTCPCWTWPKSLACARLRSKSCAASRELCSGHSAL